MPDALLENFVRERDQKLGLITAIRSAAADANRDLNADDGETIRAAKERIKTIDHQLELIGDDLEMDADTRDRLRKLQPGGTLDVPKYRSAGEMVWDVLHGTMGSVHNVEDQSAAKRWDMVMKRAAEHMGTTAAATTPVAGGFGGLYVQPVVGPVIDLYPAGRPFVSAVGTRPAPNSLTFTRPRIVDPDFKTGAGVQALQKGELVSKKFDVAVDNLSLVTTGGYLNASLQLLSLQPSSLDTIVGQLQKRVAWQSEAAAIAQVGTTTATVPLGATADAGAVIKAVYDAAALYYNNTFSLPSWIAMGVTGWARLGSLTDSSKRPLFPTLGAANALGTASADSFATGPAGLTPIVSPAITTPDLYVGGADSIEVYEYAFPILEAIEPSVLGRQIAVASAMTFFMPTTKEAVTGGTPAPAEHNSVVKIVWAP